jgi:type III pantothenate kinase
MIVVDVGNTRIKWASVASGGALVALGQAAHREAPAAAVAAFAAALPSAATKVWIANVAGPELKRLLASAVRARLGIDPKFASVAAEQLGVRCGYADAARLGVDRWLGVLAAYCHAPRPACVVNAGTAVTFDAVDAAGQHLGGLILAGPRLAARALELNTADIGPTAVAAAPPHAGRPPLGRSTDEAVGFGAMLAIAGAVERGVRAVREALDSAPTVYLTGGDAAVLAPWLETPHERRADLVLEGLALLAAHDAAAERAV